MVTGIVIPAAANLPLREIDINPDGTAVSDAVGGFMEAVDLSDFGVTI